MKRGRQARQGFPGKRCRPFSYWAEAGWRPLATISYPKSCSLGSRCNSGSGETAIVDSWARKGLRVGQSRTSKEAGEWWHKYSNIIFRGLRGSNFLLSQFALGFYDLSDTFVPPIPVALTSLQLSLAS